MNLSRFVVKIGGSQISDAMMHDITEIVVDSNIHMPDMVTIELNDDQLQWVDEAQFDIGKEVEISVETEGVNRQQMTGTLFKGELTALEPDFSYGIARMRVRGYDKSHRLHMGKKIRAFTQQKDSDIASTIAGEAGLSLDADATTVTHPYMIQNNLTNMEYLLARAHQIGYQVHTSEGKLHFKKGYTTGSDASELEWGESLYTFRPRVSATHQTEKVEVRGWDPMKKEAIVSEVTPSTDLQQGGFQKTGGATAKSAFQAAKSIVVTRPIFSVDEAKGIATAVADELGGEFIQAEGLCLGNPTMKAGSKVRIKGVGTRFSGNYYITAATHVYNQDGYTTSFTVSVRQPNTISHLVGSSEPSSEGRFYGVVTGLVTSQKDPDNLGRIKVKFPWLSDELESHWVRIASPMAGPDRGMMYLPEVNDEVLLAFEHGDPRFPYMVGALWNSKDKPPAKNDKAVEGGKVNQRIIKTRAGHVIILDDKQGEEQIIIRDKTEKNEIVITSKDNTISIVSEKDIKVTAKGDITMKATGDIALDCKNFSLKSQQNSSIKATQNIELKATQNATIEATQSAELKANLSVTVEGKTAVDVKTAGMGKVAVSPASVSINNGALEVT